MQVRTTRSERSWAAAAVPWMCPSARVPAVFPASVWCRPTAASAVRVRAWLFVFVEMGGCRFSCVCLSLHRCLRLPFGCLCILLRYQHALRLCLGLAHRAAPLCSPPARCRPCGPLSTERETKACRKPCRKPCVPDCRALRRCQQHLVGKGLVSIIVVPTTKSTVLRSPQAGRTVSWNRIEHSLSIAPGGIASSGRNARRLTTGCPKYIATVLPAVCGIIPHLTQ